MHMVKFTLGNGKMEKSMVKVCLNIHQVWKHCVINCFSKGAKYDGEWNDDKATGNGIFIYSNGDKYDGKLFITFKK